MFAIFCFLSPCWRSLRFRTTGLPVLYIWTSICKSIWSIYSLFVNYSHIYLGIDYLIKAKVWFQLLFGDSLAVMSQEQEDMEVDPAPVSNRVTLLFIYESHIC